MRPGLSVDDALTPVDVTVSFATDTRDRHTPYSASISGLIRSERRR